MISGERQKVRQKAVRWPCGVCSKGVGSNSLQCNSCQKWVHKKCSGIKGSTSKVAKSFICSGCLNPVTSAGRTNAKCKRKTKEVVEKDCQARKLNKEDGMNCKWRMSDDHDGCEWVNVSSGTGLPGLSWTKGR